MILGIDGGLATFGWSLVTPGTGSVVACGVVCNASDPDAPKTEDRERRASELAVAVAALIRQGATRIAAERMSFPPKAKFVATLAIGLSWGVITGAATLARIPITAIPPKTWQRGIVPLRPGEKRNAAIDYDLVYAELARFVDPVTTGLDAIPKRHRTHALDACGVGVYAAMRPAQATEAA